MAISLGGVLFHQFEIPAKIRFGGRQALVVHRLPDGGRVVDTFGADDGDISWHGILAGPDAAYRARTLDGIRVSGKAVTLAWDSFLYQVVVNELNLDYRNRWWIPYRLICTVTQDPDSAAGGGGLGLLSQIQSDLQQAGAYYNVSSALAAIAQPNALQQGTQAFATALSAITTSQTSIEEAVSNANTGLGSTSLGDQVVAAGQLAQLLAAAAYVSRAATNLSISTL
jgi:hypothetical protein